MIGLLCFSVLLLFLAIGDVIAVKSKALISSLFVFAAILMVSHWFGLPSDIINNAGVIAIGGIVSGLMLVHIGTTVSIAEFKAQWKTVLIGFAAVVWIGLGGVFILPMFMDKVTAYAGTPVLAGGVAALLMISQPLQEAGLVEPEIYALLICVLQFLVGIPIASYIVKKDAKEFVASGRINEYRGKKSEVAITEKKKLIPTLPSTYLKPTVYLFKTGIVATLAYWISGKTGGTLNGLLLCMVLGVLFHELGFLEKNILDKANAGGFVLSYCSIYIFMNAYKATPELIISLIIPLILMFVMGIIVLLINAFIMSKIIKESFMMCFAIGLTALFGFPATLYISKEISEAVSEGNEEDRVALEEYILPKLLIAGFSTLTIGSVVLATFIVPMIRANI